jgi:hypothetical protein
MDKLVLFNDKESFQRAYIYARRRGYRWGWQSAQTFEKIKRDLPAAAKNYALCLSYNELTKRNEITYQTMVYYLGRRNENLSNYVLEDYRL